MSLQYSRSLLRVAVAQICQQLGWNAIQSTPLELLTDILERYVSELGRQSHRFSELFGRTEPNLDDLGLAFEELQVSISELHDYTQHVDSLPFAFDVVQFPAPKASRLAAVDHDEKEQIPSLAEGVVALKADLEDGRVSPHATANMLTPTAADGMQNLKSPNASGARPFTSPTEAAPAAKRQRILPDEAAHSQYEMKSFVRSDSGVLYPTGQGKVADARNPMLLCTPTPTELVPPVHISGSGATASIVPKPYPQKAFQSVKMKNLAKIPRMLHGSPAKPRGMKGMIGLPRKGFKSVPKVSPEPILFERPEPSLARHEEEALAEAEDPRARESRLNAYDDAIDSVIRRVQVSSAEELVAAEADHEDNWSSKVEVAVPLITSPVMQRVKEEKDARDARISDTIDAVISGACWSRGVSVSSPQSLPVSHQQPESPAPASIPPESPLRQSSLPGSPLAESLPPKSPPPESPQVDDEDEIVEVHSESPIIRELSPEVVYHSPSPEPLPMLPSPPLAHVVMPVRTLAERKVIPEDLSVRSSPLQPLNLSEVRSSSKTKRQKKPKSRAIIESPDADDVSPPRFPGVEPAKWSPVPAPLKEELKPEFDDWTTAEDKSPIRVGTPIGLQETLSRTRLDEPSMGSGGWSDEDMSSPMMAAESLMTLAGIKPPPLKRLRISFGSGKDRTVDDMMDAEDLRPKDRKPQVKVETVATDRARFNDEIVQDIPHFRPTERRHEMDLPKKLDLPKKSDKHEHSKSRSRDRKDKKTKDHHREKIVEHPDHRKDKKQSKKEREREKEKEREKFKREHKEHKKHDKDKKEKTSEDLGSIPHIPKMTIKFGGGLSGGTPNSVSVNTLDSTPAAAGSLKLVIRPFATDSPSYVPPKSSPQISSKQPKHRSSPSKSPKPQRSFNILGGRPNESISHLSPVQFTSSSESSSEDSPYHPPARTPTPPSLASPAPQLLNDSPRSSYSSPVRSSPSSSPTRSPPTLYRSPEVEDRPPVFESVSSSRGRRSSPPLPAFPSYPPSRYNSPSVSSVPQKPHVSTQPVIPAMPPPALKSSTLVKSTKAKQQSVVTETVSKIVADNGDITWICPACKMPDDGSPMIGCDICDDWYHWPCVGIVSEPPEDEQWFCKRCTETNQLSTVSKGGKSDKKKKPVASVSVGRSRSKKPVKKK